MQHLPGAIDILVTVAHAGLKKVLGDEKGVLGRIEVRREVFVENLALSLQQKICI